MNSSTTSPAASSARRWPRTRSACGPRVLPSRGWTPDRAGGAGDGSPQLAGRPLGDAAARRRGIAAGLTIGCARALGEYGATLMVGGDINGKTRTLSLAILDSFTTPERNAMLLILVLMAITAMAGVGLLGRSRGMTVRARRRGHPPNRRVRPGRRRSRWSPGYRRAVRPVGSGKVVDPGTHRRPHPSRQRDDPDQRAGRHRLRPPYPRLHPGAAHRDGLSGRAVAPAPLGSRQRCPRRPSG